MSNILAPDESTFGKTGIPVHRTWNILDSTKIKCLMGCPRDFFYSYILGWRKEGPSIHLSFGHAWHSAMEVLLKKGPGANYVLEAYDAFIKDYQELMEMDIMTLENLHPSKTPSKALLGLTEYSEQWPDDPNLTKYVEVAGTAPINETDRVIHVKLDSIRVYGSGHINEGKFYSLEHKTTTRQTEAWEEQWNYDFQIGTYDHFLKCMYEPEEVSGVVINGAVFNKSVRRFPRFPITRSPEMWDLWRGEANHYWDYLERNMEALYETKESDTAMLAFPRNSASCSKFGCRHPHLCSIKANPLQRMQSPPLEYGIDYWDPTKAEESAELVVHLEKKEEV